ncbi:MAG: nucleotide kinase domain-containing protein [Vicinamibacterales bacterium]
MTMLPERLADVAAWAREREAIRIRKDAGAPWPWTTNALLRDFRWCNVRRCDDRVTRELLASWYSPASEPSEHVVAAALARLVNWPDALLDSTGGQPFRLAALREIRQRLAARAARKEKVFTGAYIVPGVPGRSKVDSVCDLVDAIAAQAPSLVGTTLRATWRTLLGFDGLGSFLAGQVAADLALLPAGARWPDVATWAPIGPGSARGWNRLTGQPVGRHVSQDEFDEALPRFIGACRERFPEIWAAKALVGQDCQSLLCELDKYWRLRAGEGSVRARYQPGGLQAALL